MGEEIWIGTQKIWRWRIPDTEIREHELKMLEYQSIPDIISPAVQRENGEVILDYLLPYSTEFSLKPWVEKILRLWRRLPEYLLAVEGLWIGEGMDGANFFYLPTGKFNWDLDYFQKLFQNEARFFLQLEMMKESGEMTISNYLQALENFYLTQRPNMI